LRVADRRVFLASV